MDLVQLVLVNNSKQPGNMIVFKRYDDTNTPVAWFSKYLYTAGHFAFSWNPWDLCFVWAASADIGPGTLFEAGGTAAADIHENRAVVFSYDREHRTFFFKDERPGADYNYNPLTVVQDATIPANAAAVGIGIAGRATSVVRSLPNSRIQMDPRGTTWVTFGKAREGEIFDVKDAVEPVQVEFPPNIDSMTVTLNADNSWSVKENIMRVDEA